MRKQIENQLAGYAKKVIAREQPEIIAVTGSVGKSSAKQGIKAVLEEKFSVRVSPKNYNTEIGVPLSVLGLESGDSSSVKWMHILSKAFMMSLGRQKDFPGTLVLEMAADHKGDIKKLCGIAPPLYAVVTAVGESHTESLGTVEEIAKEKRVLVESVGTNGVVFLNRDDERVWAMREHTKGKVVSFGFHPEADVRASEESMNVSCSAGGKCGMNFKIDAGGSTVPVFLPYVLGRHAIYAALIAAAVATEKGMNMVEVSDRLREYKAPPGRMSFILGIKSTVLLDDTYNAAPKSMDAALDALASMGVADGNKKFAVLGDMLELGNISSVAHFATGKKVADLGVDVAVFVGELMGEAKKGAISAGMAEDKIFHFAKAEEAGRFVQDRMKQGDVVLAKGSRGMHMEVVIKELMAEPMRAAELLVGDWSQ